MGQGHRGVRRSVWGLLPVYSFFLFASLVLAGCGGVSQTAPEGKSSNPIKVAIKLPSGVSMLSGGRVKSTNPRIAATTITAIKLEVTGEGIESPIIADVPIPPAGSNVAEVVIDVPFGLARLFQVTITTSTGSVFRGSTTLDIDAGKATLNPATSELEIPVTIDVNVDIDAPVTTVSPSAGIYNKTQVVTVTCKDVFSNQSGCVKMFLTTDGTAPLSTDSPVQSTTAVGAQLTHTVNITAEGATTLKFFSIDGENNEEDVKTAPYTIDTIAPNAPVITLPAATSTSNSSSITFTGTAEVPTSTATAVTITLKSDLDGNIGTAPVDSSGAWSITATITDGAHTITATATDEAQNTSLASTAVSVTVDTVAPLAPVINSLTTPTNINSFTISGTAEANSTVTVFDGGITFSTATAGSGGIWSIPSGTLADGTHSFTATATDSFNNTGPASAAVSVTVDTLAPSAPAIDPLTTPTKINSFTISGTAEANSTVAVFESGSAFSTATAGSGGIWSIPSGTLADGTYSFTATAMDAAGNTGPASTGISVTIDSTPPPAPVITSPSSGTTVNNFTSTVSGTAEANSQIEIFEGTTSIGNATSDGSGNWSTSLGILADGTFSITAVATDAVGNTGPASTPITITIDTTIPSAPVITSPKADFTTADTTLTITGTAPAGSSVVVSEGTTTLGSTMADGSGNWSLVSSVLSAGSHTITATATNTAGTSSPASASVTFTIDTSAAFRILGKWGFGNLTHRNTGGAWGVEGGTVTFNSDGTGSLSAREKDSTGSLTTLTENFAYTATDNSDGSITLVQTFPDTTTDTTILALSDDNSMMIEDSTADPSLQGLSVAVRMDTAKTFSNADFTGAVYSIGYEHDAAPTPKLYRARSSINTVDGAGGITFSDFANENGTFTSVPGSTSYSINADGTFTAGAADPKPITGHIGANGLITVDTTANSLGTATPPWWSMDFNMVKGDKTYSTADLAGTWAFVGFGDDGGTTFNSDFGTLTCDTAGNCTVSGRENMNGSFNAMVNETTNGPFTVAPDGSFGTSLHSGLSPSSPAFAAAIGNGGNTIIINESFDDSVTSNKTNRFIAIAVKCAACSGLGENTGFPIAATSSPEGGVDAAFDGTNWLVGVQGQNLFGTGNGQIAAQMIDASGAPVGGLIQIPRTGGAPHIAFDGTNYLMVWPDDANKGTTGTNDIYGQFIDTAGAFVGSPFLIASGTQLSGSGNEEFGGLAFGGGKYLAVYYKEVNSATKNSQVFGRLIDTAGKLVGSEVVISSRFGDFGIHSVAFNGTDFLVVWDRDDTDTDVMGRFVSTAGVPKGTAEFTISANLFKNDNPLSVACDSAGGLCAVAWLEEYDAANGKWDVFVRMVAPSGPVGSEPNVTAGTGNKFFPFIAWDGTKFLLTWSDRTNDLNNNMVCDSGESTCWDMYGQYIDATGAKVGNPFVISDDIGNQLGGPIFGGGQSLVLINNGTGISQTAPADDLFGLFIPSANTSGFTQPSIAAGQLHSLVLKSDGTVWAWGFNSSGELGDGTTANRFNPVQVTGLAGIVEISAGNIHNLALKSDGTVWAWGSNSVGQLGNGTSGNISSTPVQVSGLTGVTAIAAGGAHNLALLSDGSVWAWGFNGDGQLGATTTESCGVFSCSSIPVQVSGLTGVIAVAAGSAHSLALKSDGTVWAWGNNIRGQLGDGSVVQKNTPVQVSGLTGVVTAIAGGGVHSLALKSDGTVWAWGSNFNGQLGNSGAGSTSSTPVQVTGLTGVTAIAAATATDHSFALLSDGTVWAWGDNANGQLGTGDLFNKLTPVQVVSGLTGVTAIATGIDHTLALKDDGTISTWGGNSSGQLGNGATIDSSTPVQAVDTSSVPFNIGVQATKITSAVPGAESITVNWSANAAAGSYNLYWDTSPGVNTANGTKVSGLTGTSFTHTGLSAENDYYYVVTVVSGSAESPISNEIFAAPQTAAPTGVVGDPENKQNRIAWNPLPGADSFKIYWNTAGSVTTADSSFTSPVSYATHTGLGNGTTYYYRVAGVNPGGEGALSAEMSVIPTTVGALLGHSDGAGIALANAVADAGGENDTNPLAMNNPHDIAIDPDGLRMFVADVDNNRILAFPLDSSFNIASRKAVSVIGQPDFSHNDIDQGRTSAGADTLDGARGVAYFNDGTNKWLLVADTSNHRVLIYDITSGITDGMSAVRVLGQADFTSELRNRTGTTSPAFQNSLREPARVIVAKVGTATLVIVADRFNDRVMIWDITTVGIAGLWDGSTGKQNADYVIGQYSTTATGCAPDVNGVTSATSGCTPDFTISGSNNTGGGVGDGSLNDPTGLVMWGNNLVVADQSNDRVMVFDLGVNGANLSTTQALFATFELGQTDFTGVFSSSGLGRFGGPESMAVLGNLLFVADEFNNRVYVFDLSTPSNGMNPVYVYGQTSLSGSVANTAQNGLNRPEGLAIAGNSLFVSEVINDRLVQYDITNIVSDISGSAFGPNAVDLLGQTDWRPGMTDGTEAIFWDTGGGNDTGAVGFQKPKDAATGTINGVNYIFVTDFYNDRVLVFEADRFFNPKDLQADFVIGEPDFDHDAGSVTQDRLNSPHGVAFDDSPTGLTSKFLFVSDRDHNRVMVFDLSGGITNGMAATAVLGQTGFTSSLINGTGSTTPALNGLYNPRRLNIATVGGTKYLFVAERNNARVSIFNISDGVTTGENASFFLGNADGVTKSTVISKSIMTTPYSTDYDPVGQRLFVVDRSANRVLVYDLSAGITTGMAAVNVIGQSDFVTTTAGTSPSKFNLPQDVAYDSANQQLFVSDFTGNRVLVFDIAGGITDGMSASGVIGQSDFTSSTGHIGTSRASLTMKGPSGVWYEPHYGRLFITESSDNRVLVLNPTSGQFTASPIPDFASSVTATKEIGLSWGAVTGAVSYNVYRGTAPGVNTTTGTLVSGGLTTTTFTDTALTPGTYYYVVTVVDSSGVESPISNEVHDLAQGTSGDLDLSFAAIGHATLDITGFKDKGISVAIDSQDRIIVGGESGASGAQDFALARYFEDGTLDSSFGTNGVVTTDISGAGSDDQIRDIAIDSADNIIAVGMTNTGGALDMAIVRYSSNGALDTTFGTGGIVTVDSGGIDDIARAVEIYPSGKILVAGQFAGVSTSDFAVVRLNGNGTLDTTFNPTGTVPGTATHDFGGTIDKARGLAIDSSGGILVSGDFESSPGSGALEFGLIRLNSNGTLDTSFGFSGENSAFIGNGKASGGLAIDANGNIVLAGEKASAINPADQDFILVRFSSAGQLDSTFGSAGTVITDINGATDWAEKILIDANQKIIVLGYVTADDIGTNGDFAVVRYNSDGTPDTNFAGSGKVTSHFGMNQVIFGGTRDADNRIVAAGAGGTGTNRLFEVARYWNNGFPYTGPSAIFKVTQPSIAGGEFHTLALKEDGTVWAWGLNADGQLGDGTKVDSATPVQVTGLPAGATVTAISGGSSHSLALLSDGTLWAWGFNFNGELGNGTFTDSSTPVQVTGLPTGATVVAISAGGHHNLALLSDGSVWAWGFNSSGQLGDGTTTGSNTPVKVTGLTGVVTAIAAGGEHSFVLLSDGTVWAWGFNSSGQLGDGTTIQKLTPVQVTGLPAGATVTAISAGGHHFLAILSDVTVRAWGNNFSGELGDGTTIDSSTPVPVTGLTGVTGVVAGRDHSIALLSDGTVRAWGFNSSGQLGATTTEVCNSSSCSTSPVQVTGLTGVTDIAGGGIHSIALLSDGTISSWGDNSSGQLGDGTTSTTPTTTPAQAVDSSSVPFGLSTISATAVGGKITLSWNAVTGAVSYNVYRGTARGVSKANGTLVSSGSSATTFTDVFITPDIKYHYVVTAVDSSGVEGPTSSQVGALAAPTSAFTHTAAIGGGSHTLALKDDGTVWAWGANWYGQIGSGTSTDSSRPVQVSGLTGVTAIAGGAWHSLALKSDGTVWAWGGNWNGQLGNGTFNNSLMPVQVAGLPTGVTVVAISAGSGHSLALLSDGTLWAWGANWYGQLGNGTFNSSSTPVQVIGLPTGATVTAIAAGHDHSLALLSDGTVWAWGANFNGELGVGTTTSSATPAQVSNLTGVTAIAAGDSHSLALLSDGTLWAWGANWYGQLGNGTTSTTATSMPVQVSGLAGVIAVSAGDGHSVALKSDGTIWAWGANWDGQLGDGTFSNSSTPVQATGFPTDTTVAAIAAGGSHNIILKSDGTILAWGGNFNGQLGDGTTNEQTMPVPAIDSASVPFNVVSGILTVDTVPPSSPSVVINSGAASTSSAVVTLGLSATDDKGVVGYFVSESSVTPAVSRFIRAPSAVSFSTTTSFPLSAGDGLKTVNAWFIDVAGRISGMASASITLDSTLATSADCLAAVNSVQGVEKVNQSLIPGMVVAAKTTCTAAANALSGVTSNDADTARFFSAFSRIAANGFDFTSDNNRTNGLNTTGELLEAFGCDSPGFMNGEISCSVLGTWKDWTGGTTVFAADGTYTFTPGSPGGTYTILGDVITFDNINSYRFEATTSQLLLFDVNTGSLQMGHDRVISSTAPTGAELQARDDLFKTELDNAVADLNAVSQSFNVVWWAGSGGTGIESDYGDVLTVRGLAKAMLGWISVENSYDLNVDIGALANATTPVTTQQFLIDYPNFLTLSSTATARLSAAQTYVSGASDDLTAAINWILAETDAQSDDFINLVNSTMADINGMQTDLANIKGSLTTPTTFTDQFGAQKGILDMTNFFAGMSLRSLLPTFTGDTPGLFPDATFNGVWTGFTAGSAYDVNTDVMDKFGLPVSDGIPDILQSGLFIPSTSVSGFTQPSIAGGGTHTLALKSDGTAWAWGDNSFGQLGNETTSNSSNPVQVSSLSGVVKISAGNTASNIHSLALKSDGTVWAWGWNGSGQLGDGTTTQRLMPVPVIGLTGVTDIAAGDVHSLALKSDGTVWAWGDNTNGQLGNGTSSTAPNVSPVQVSSLTGITAIAAGRQHSLALKSDGTVWAWGNNTSGELGDGTTGQRLTPVQVSGLTGVTAIAGGGWHSLALKSDGTVWAWGNNTSGQLGDGTTGQRLTPVQVSGLTGVTAIAGGAWHSLVLKSDGTLWAWGDNTLGQLGNSGAGSGSFTPVQVTGLTGTSAIAAGFQHSIALLIDGTVWTWGDNGSGQLGATTSATATPVQVVDTSSTPFNIGANIPVTTARATATAVGEITVTWNAAPLAASYNVYRGTAPGVTTTTGTLVGSGITGTSFTDTGLTPGTTYYYVATTVNAIGKSPISNEASELAQGTSGDLDLSFAGQGYTSVNFSTTTWDEAHGVTFDSSGRIIVVGEISDSTLLDFGIVRLKPDGTPDSSFGSSGIVRANFGASYSFSHAHEVAIDANGKIVIAGIADSGSLRDWALTRYNSDGTLDTSFGDTINTPGIIVTDMGGNNDKPWQLVIDSAGRIVVAGQSGNSTGGYDFAVARYTANGTLDTTFNSAGSVPGTVLIDFNGQEDHGRGMAIDSSGSIVVTGSTVSASTSAYDFAVARLLSTGTLDTTFGGGTGLVTTDLGGIESEGRIAIDSSGKILVAGVTASAGSLDADFAMVRYNANGTLDSTFGTGGVVITDFAQTYEVARDIAIDPNGKIVVGGKLVSFASFVSDIAIARYNSDGTLDTNFSGDGLLTTHVDAEQFMDRMMLDADGRIVAVGAVNAVTNGTANASFLVTRHWNNGFASVAASSRAVSFSTADIAGTWYRHRLDSGSSSPASGLWEYGELSIDSTGTGTWISKARSDDPGPALGTESLRIDISGELYPYNPDMHGWMSEDKNMMAVVESKGLDHYHLHVYTRGGGTFVGADMAISSLVHAVCSTASSGAWLYFDQNVLADGSGSQTMWVDSGGGNTPPAPQSPAEWLLSAAGIVANPLGGFNSTLHGIRSLDNLLEIGTLTSSAPDECLYVGMVPAGSYSTADLQGKWHAVQFITGNAGWRKNEFSVDASGNLVEDTFLREDGTGNFSTTPSSISVMSVSSFGDVTVSAWPTFHGAMSADKKLIIGTRTKGTPPNEQYRFEVWMK